MFGRAVADWTGYHVTNIYQTTTPCRGFYNRGVKGQPGLPHRRPRKGEASFAERSKVWDRRGLPAFGNHISKLTAQQGAAKSEGRRGKQGEQKLQTWHNIQEAHIVDGIGRNKSCTIEDCPVVDVQHRQRALLQGAGVSHR
jgi:hypothetical protein